MLDFHDQALVEFVCSLVSFYHTAISCGLEPPRRHGRFSCGRVWRTPSWFDSKHLGSSDGEIEGFWEATQLRFHVSARSVRSLKSSFGISSSSSFASTMNEALVVLTALRYKHQRCPAPRPTWACIFCWSFRGCPNCKKEIESLQERFCDFFLKFRLGQRAQKIFLLSSFYPHFLIISLKHMCVCFWNIHAHS